MGEQSAERRQPRDTLAWLLQTTGRMVRCRTVPALLDLAYEAIRDGLGYDRVGLSLVDESDDSLVLQRATNWQRWYVRPTSEA